MTTIMAQTQYIVVHVNICRWQWLPTGTMAADATDNNKLKSRSSIQHSAHENKKHNWTVLWHAEVTLQMSRQIRRYTTVQCRENVQQQFYTTFASARTSQLQSTNTYWNATKQFNRRLHYRHQQLFALHLNYVSVSLDSFSPHKHCYIVATILFTKQQFDCFRNIKKCVKCSHIVQTSAKLLHNVKLLHCSKISLVID